jgi:non-specific serine/threonine protein kinase
LTSFIGREREHVAVEGLLARAPLVTLIGVGGCGKTRLALQVAADLLEGYPDGIWLVELAAVGAIASGDTPLVLQAVATALNLREESGRSLMETLIDTLASRRLLLVLDNCEHLVAACAELAAVLLRRCPRLQILATSREHLAIRGETSYRVPSLSLPEPDHHSRTAAPADYEAVRLFVERARAVHPAFTLSAENVGTVVQVCARLAGIPLAIELAAAAAARLPVATIAARLEQSIGVLTGGPRDVLPRHRTLRAALDWSWTLLSEQEQALLRRLSVFAGGWRLGAAVAVCTGDGIADWAVPDLLDGLANKSLAAPDERDDGGRRGLLETVRQYADERLAEAGEQATTRDRHLDWCVALAGEAEEQLKGPGQGAWLARLDREHDNLRAALGWARARARGTLELRLAGALWRFWLTRGYLSEGRGWLEGALSGGTEAPSSVRANALTGAGVLAGQQGDHGQAAAFFEEALMLRRALGDTRLVANALHNLAQLTKMRQDYGRAVTLHEEALALYRARDDKPGIALSLAGLGNIALRQGDNKRAAVLHEEALTLYRVLGDTQWIAGSLGNLGNVAHNQGDYARATSLHEEALTLQRTLGDKIGITRSLHNLGLAAYARADYGRTTTLLTEALPLCGELGDRELLADGLELAALVASARRHHRKAARLGGIAEGLRQALGIPLTPDLHTSHEQAARLTRAALGEAAFARAWAEGRALPVEQAIALARADSPDG